MPLTLEAANSVKRVQTAEINVNRWACLLKITFRDFDGSSLLIVH
jgi:hypothetical protein